MTRREIENGIYRSWKFLEELGIAESFSNPAPLAVNEEFRDFALDPETTYPTLYMNGLQNSHYNILLSDHGYFQYSWVEEENLRFAYYANPFVSPGSGAEKFKKIRDLFMAELINLEQFHALLNDAKPESRIPLIRYENSPSQYRGLRHPCSHFHIGHHSENRWAVRRIISPLAFTMLIARQYYNREWQISDDKISHDFNLTLEAKFIAEKENCRILGDDLFIDKEARSFHFS